MFSTAISVMRSRADQVAEPMCGTTSRFGACHSGSSAGSGSGVVTSSAAPAIWPVCSASRERLAVDDRAARGVDQDRGRLHQREGLGADQVAGARGQRQVDRDEVRAAQQVLEVVLVARLGREHLHAEAGGAARDRLADAAEADDPERRAGDVGAEEAAGIPGVPLAAVRERRRLGDPARRRHQQREGEVGGGLGQCVGRVADRDAARAWRRRRRCCRSRPRSWRSPAASVPPRSAPRRRGR